MSRFESPLNSVKIASPCSANWDEMFGNERKRFCGECKLNVYNLSGMTKYDAENLLTVSEGRLCVRYFQRSDGTILTADCPVGWAKVKQRLSVCATAVFSMLMAVIAGLTTVSFLKNNDLVRRIPIPFATPTPEPLMGAIETPRPSPSPTPKATPDGRKDGWTMGKPARPTEGPATEFAE
ncbi:MAG: hypothetical protein HOP17_13075 [Acidobacteria bacterium]|nr:hypothetical protein [Acidobacteriota bacterium]